ncbi:MAG TPA: MBL fold metallo-hydrolase [Terriglobia bacterium]|nr:MBL fold metallo-hydrolase [Terriglobia bacterium]
MANLTFFGAARTVTGSKYLLEAAGERLMIDCGLFQGHKELRLRNWSPLPVDPSSIHWLVLTHAHLDHTGYIPRLVKEGFHGEVWASPATVDLAHLVLPDSGHLQEEDARYANKKGFSKHKPALPLYTQEEANQSLELFRVVDEAKPLELSSHFKLRFFRAGHILGARMVEVTVTEGGKTVKVLFSGDLGRFPQLIIREPAVPDGADYLLCESTYGDRLHPTDDFRARLARIVESTAERGGSVIIPSFAIGRTQELLYLFRQLINGNQMHDLPIHVDSPMAIDATDLYRKHHEDHNLQTDEFEAGGHRLFAQPNVHFDRSVEQSKALNECHFPTIIISASGMATGGRVLHHLARCLPDHRNTVLFVGFQAPGTRGHIIQSGAEMVKIHGQQVPIRAHVETIENLSAHADYSEILSWLGKFPAPPRKTFVTHGELHAATALQEKMTQELGWKAEVPSYLDSVSLGG